MQETDFPATDGFAPLDAPILLGLDPVFLAALVLLLLAVALGMYRLGRRNAEKSGSGSDAAPAEIHTAILKSSRVAMAADSNDLRGRVQTLRDLIERLLGPVLALNKGLAGALKDMDAALKGEIKDKHGHDVGHGAGHAGDPGDAHGKPDAGRHGEEARSGGGSAAAASSTIAVIGHPIHIHTAPDPAHPPHARHASHGETRPMTHDEQTSALALSVRRFNDHWSKSDLRVRELRAARAALSRHPPADVVRASDTRVWDRR